MGIIDGLLMGYEWNNGSVEWYGILLMGYYQWFLSQPAKYIEILIGKNLKQNGT